MPVTDDEVAALRAHLQGNQPLWQELYARLSTPAPSRYVTLVAEAFFEAVVTMTDSWRNWSSSWRTGFR
jgi:hypothetical protein